MRERFEQTEEQDFPVVGRRLDVADDGVFATDGVFCCLSMWCVDGNA
jgi:hypothetical protein